MRKVQIVFLCLFLAGNILLSGCTSRLMKTQVVEVEQASATAEKSITSTLPAAKATSTKTASATQTGVLSTKSPAITVTPTITGTVSLAVEIDKLLNSLFSDLENTDVIQETEIP